MIVLWGLEELGLGTKLDYSFRDPGSRRPGRFLWCRSGKDPLMEIAKSSDRLVVRPSSTMKAGPGLSCNHCCKRLIDLSPIRVSPGFRTGRPDASAELEKVAMFSSFSLELLFFVAESFLARASTLRKGRSVFEIGLSNFMPVVGKFASRRKEVTSAGFRWIKKAVSRGHIYPATIFLAGRGFCGPHYRFFGLEAEFFAPFRGLPGPHRPDSNRKGADSLSLSAFPSSRGEINKLNGPLDIHSAVQDAR